MKAINVQSGKIVGGRNVAFVLASQIDRSKHAVTTRMQSKTLSDSAKHGLDQTSPAFWVADDSPVKRHTDMKAKMKWIVIIFVSAVLTTATIAKDTALWDGTCHNVTHQLDGYLKLLIQQDGTQISG